MQLVRSMIGVALASAWLLACSGDGARGGLRVGMAGPDGGVAGAGGFGNSATGGTNGSLPSSDNALEVEIQHDTLAVELITLRCAGDCAEVEAVASGGHEPYTFAWDDGPAGATRMLCPEQTRSFGVEVTDTAIEADELGYEAQTARAEVTAEVLRCAEDGGLPPIESDCGPGATAPLQLVVQRESVTTDVYVQENGNLADYSASVYGAPPTPLAIVASAQREIHLGSCTQLLLAADAAGTQDVGWDDTLIVEYRSAPGAAVDKRWLYGAVSPVTYLPTNEQLTSTEPPAIPGWDLQPPVPNPLPFGYPALAIDLMRAAPSDAKDFELTLHVLDASAFGSTTDIWLIPR